tara:strand:+ start:7602 stop:8636 length:1035 start_codon:yes stop_codon:yes gene_type:complete
MIKSNILLKISLILFTLWDIYSIHLGKVFDVVGIFFVLLYILLKKKVYIETNLNVKILLFMYSMIMMLTIFNGYLQEFFVVNLGLIVFLCFNNLPRKNDFSAVVEAIFYLIIFFQVLQFSYYLLYGENLIFYPISFFNAPRNYSASLDFFRATGFFAEANAIVTTTLLLNMYAQAVNYKRKNVILIFTIFSNVIAKSIFGFILIPFYIMMVSSLSFKVKISSFLLLIFVVIYNADLSIYMYRFDNFTDDQSFSVRLGLNSLSENLHKLFIPSGFDVIGSSKIGINGFYFMLNAFGVFSLYLLIIKYKLLGKNAFILFILSLATYQMFTTQLFWAILGLSINRKK